MGQKKLICFIKNNISWAGLKSIAHNIILMDKFYEF